MSSYSRIIFYTLIFFSFIGCTNNPTKDNIIAQQKYDLKILVALDSEIHSDFVSAKVVYQNLFEQTHKKLYLKKAILYSFKSNDFDTMYKLSLSGLKLFPQDKEYFSQQKIVALISLDKLDEAIKLAYDLLKEFKGANTYEVLATALYAKKDYKNALKYYESAYAKKQTKDRLLKLTAILYSYLNKKDDALAYLETYVQTHKCDKEVCNKLMLIYQEQGNIDGMVSILKKIYNNYKDISEYSKMTKMIENTIVKLLEQKDPKEAIKFLEESKTNQTKLISLYYQVGDLKKALKLTRILYKKTKSPELLGSIAMYEFELAKNKKRVLKHVLANFELALSSGINNPSYQNYYGYLLIDYNINIKKGVKFVKMALKTTPNNIAYLDSLAWGYYKLHKYKEAWKTIQYIVKKIGLDNQDIKYHYQAIKKALKQK